jgi:hypothetical protein
LTNKVKVDYYYFFYIFKVDYYKTKEYNLKDLNFVTIKIIFNPNSFPTRFDVLINSQRCEPICGQR